MCKTLLVQSANRMVTIAQKLSFLCLNHVLLHLQMWRYEGHRTLSYYLKRRDCIAALSEDLGVDKTAVVATIFKQILESIAVSPPGNVTF